MDLNKGCLIVDLIHLPSDEPRAGRDPREPKAGTDDDGRANGRRPVGESDEGEDGTLQIVEAVP